MNDLFNLKGKVAIVTGAGGLLGKQHCEAIASAGGTPILLDLYLKPAQAAAEMLKEKYGVPARAYEADITRRESLESIRASVLKEFGRIDILINNAANNPKVEAKGDVPWSRLENFPMEQWHADIAVGLTGAFLCSQIFGVVMAEKRSGVILNIASDLAVIAPDQRLYRKDGIAADKQPVKPVTYSVVKTGLVGLTRYLATYWADAGVRVNAISPGGVEQNQPQEFLDRISQLIPLGRMAKPDEYRGVVLFLVSDASTYLTGQNLIIDGGRSCW